MQRPPDGLLGGLWEHPAVVLPSAGRGGVRGAGAAATGGSPPPPAGGGRRRATAGGGGEGGRLLLPAADRRALAAVVAAAGGGDTAVESVGAPVAEVVHLFSHIRQTLIVHRLHVDGPLATAVAAAAAAAARGGEPREWRWVTRDGLAAAAVSTGMRKAFAAAVGAADG